MLENPLLWWLILLILLTILNFLPVEKSNIACIAISWESKRKVAFASMNMSIVHATMHPSIRMIISKAYNERKRFPASTKPNQTRRYANNQIVYSQIDSQCLVRISSSLFFLYMIYVLNFKKKTAYPLRVIWISLIFYS